MAASGTKLDSLILSKFYDFAELACAPGPVRAFIQASRWSQPCYGQDCIPLLTPIIGVIYCLISGKTNADSNSALNVSRNVNCLECASMSRGPKMGVRHELKVLFEKLTRTHVYRDLPRGTNLFDDLREWLPNLRVETVFDVGANVGQSARKYLHEFPGSQIYCFEPVGENFKKLEENLRGQGKVQSFKLALSSAKGTGQMAPGGGSQMFFLSRDVPGTPSQSPVRLEEVPLETLDGFCWDRKIDRISFLKIDTEGNDLEVLKGAEELLSLQNIDVVEVEAGMNGKNKRHVPLGDFIVFLEARSYYLFGVYDQAHEWPAREPQLRRSNLVFISERTIHGNTGR